MPDKKAEKSNRRIQDIANQIQKNMNSLYTTTYLTSPRASNDVRDITAAINNNIDNIVDRNMNTIGMPSVSTLYSRLFNIANSTSGSAGVSNKISEMFEDPMMMDDLYSTFMSNRAFKDLDDEIDTVCKYMPDLEEALDAKKDSVLSADHFSKDFLNIKFPTDIDNEDFAQRVVEFKKKYKLQKLVEEIYEDTAKYGEKFVYCVPYDVAITKLLANKSNTITSPHPYIRQESVILEELQEQAQSMTESFIFRMDSNSSGFYNEDGKSFNINDAKVLTESVSINNGKKVSERTLTSILKENENFNLNVEINKSGIIDSAITEAARSNNIKRKMPTSLKESFAFNLRDGKSRKAIIEDNMPEVRGNLNPSNNIMKNSIVTASDGLIGHNPGSDKDLKKFEVTVPGAIIKKLKRQFVIPCYIEESCMGYYYIELRTKDLGDDLMGFRNILGDPLTGTSAEGRINFNNVENNRQEETLKYICGQLSQFIDKQFVNNNQDLAKEIYEILKYNDLFNTPTLEQIKVTFVPPEDIHHFYFRLDEDTHRGISDIARGLIPAKLYSSLYVTNSIGIMTRGQDKRVYYVNQMVDTNVSQQLLNVITQIKMGNFGIRQFNSINNILNITGRFNDHVIPRGPSGQSPIDIDVIPGQQFDIHSDLMEILKDMAIGSTDVPIEIVQTRKTLDYASQLSMSSSRFLRTVYKRQELFGEKLSPFISAIYNFEFNDNVELEITLPPPVFLDMANTNQLVTNTKEYVEACIDIEMQNEQDETLKSYYRKNLFNHYIGTHIDISAHKEILDRTKVEIKQLEKESNRQTESPEEEGDEGGYY